MPCSEITDRYTYKRHRYQCLAKVGCLRKQEQVVADDDDDEAGEDVAGFAFVRW